MFAGGCAGATQPRPASPRPAAPGAPRAPPPRAGGGPSGTIEALVIVASASLRVVRFSHGVVATAAAPRIIKAMLPIMVASPSEESNTRATLSHKSSSIHYQDPRNSLTFAEVRS